MRLNLRAAVLAALALFLGAAPAWAQTISTPGSSGFTPGSAIDCSSVASLCLNLQNPVGTTVFSVDKTGIVSLGSAAVGTISPTNIHLNFTGGSIPAMGVGNDGVGNAVVVLPSLGRLAWNSTNSISVNNADLLLFRDAAGTLAQRNGVNAQKACWANTWTDGSNFEYGCIDWTISANVLSIGTEKAGTGAARALQFLTGGTAQWKIDTAGNLFPNGTGYIQTNSRTVSGLATCNAGAKGARDFVTDATATTFLSAVAGSGANNVPVVCDGTSWKIG